MLYEVITGARKVDDQIWPLCFLEYDLRYSDQPPHGTLRGLIGVLCQAGLTSLIAAAISSKALLALGVTPMKS